MIVKRYKGLINLKELDQFLWMNKSKHDKILSFLSKYKLRNVEVEYYSECNWNQRYVKLIVLNVSFNITINDFCCGEVIGYFNKNGVKFMHQHKINSFDELKKAISKTINAAK